MTGSSYPPVSAPRHVGIIMDGNGRWAERQGKPRLIGHRVGAAAVRRTTEAAAKLGISQLTLFAFSSENWRRPEEEVDFLMRLFRRFLRSERDRLRRDGVRLLAVGRLAELPAFVVRELEHTIEATGNGERITLCLAVNYGGRQEIVDACRSLAARAASGRIDPEAIDADAVEASMYQPDMPPLDLVIRTGGEMRLSNFLVWQSAYAEFWSTATCWPAFGEELLGRAVAEFRRRERRFGALTPSTGEPQPIVDCGLRISDWRVEPCCPHQSSRDAHKPFGDVIVQGGD